MARKPPKDDGHRMGKRYGYTDMGDGTIKVAPMFQDEMDRLIEEMTALKTVLNHVVEFTQQQQMRLERRRVEWWRDVKAEYPLDAMGESLGYKEGVIGPIPEAKKP